MIVFRIAYELIHAHVQEVNFEVATLLCCHIVNGRTIMHGVLGYLGHIHSRIVATWLAILQLHGSGVLDQGQHTIPVRHIDVDVCAHTVMIQMKKI